jgi:hypothetical protein
MKASALEYKKEYRNSTVASSERSCFLGQEGKKYWFVSVVGKESRICSGKYWMSEGQVEKFITEL